MCTFLSGNPTQLSHTLRPSALPIPDPQQAQSAILEGSALPRWPGLAYGINNGKMFPRLELQQRQLAAMSISGRQPRPERSSTLGLMAPPLHPH